MANIITADNGSITGSAGLKSSADSSGVLALATGSGTTAVTIDASQNVGIGTSSAAQKLDVVGNIKLGNSTAQPTFILNNTSVGSWKSETQYQNSGTVKWSVGVDISAAGNNNFYWYDNTASAERMRIDSSGNLLVGTTSQLSNGKTSIYQANNGCAIEAQIVGSGTAYAVMTSRVNNTANLFHAFYYNTYSSAVGSISTNGTITAYNISSDYRLKENIVPLTGALNKITQLKPSVYNYKSKPEEAIEGFVAHELQEIVPHAVTGEKDAVDADGNPIYQGVDASFLIPHLVAAIQEQQAIITTLTERITALEAK